MKHGDRRKAQILEAGLQLWHDGESNVTARGIAKLLGMTHTAILYHYKNSDELKLSIARHAVVSKDRTVLPMLIVSRHPSVAHFTDADRDFYLKML